MLVCWSRESDRNHQFLVITCWTATHWYLIVYAVCILAVYVCFVPLFFAQAFKWAARSSNGLHDAQWAWLQPLQSGMRREYILLELIEPAQRSLTLCMFGCIPFLVGPREQSGYKLPVLLSYWFVQLCQLMHLLMITVLHPFKNSRAQNLFIALRVMIILTVFQLALTAALEEPALNKILNTFIQILVALSPIIFMLVSYVSVHSRWELQL